MNWFKYFLAEFHQVFFSSNGFHLLFFAEFYMKIKFFPLLSLKKSEVHQCM
uniref:Uncharacterized protein n=1 Tax=Setaria viridis TaxID=4556 RepID=A0A4U6V576_SETVI|nr:hypothetical protein SEVIR_4G270201v2 [Setaria viridis]